MNNRAIWRLVWIHLHHFVCVSFWERTFHRYWLVFGIIWWLDFLFRFFIRVWGLSTLLVFAIRHVLDELNLFILEYVAENNSSHMGIIGSFVVVWKKSWTFVISETIFDVKASFDVLLKFAIVCNFFVTLSKTCFKESFRISGKHFRVEMNRETGMPCSLELLICIW